MLSLPRLTNTNMLILLEAAKNLGIKTKILSSDPIKVLFSKNNRSHVLAEKSLHLNQSKKAISLARDKALTIKTLQQAGLAVPKQTTVTSSFQYRAACQIIPFPQVIKPQTGEKAKLIYLNVSNYKLGHQAIKAVLDQYPAAVVEAYHPGQDYRFLVLNFKVIGLAQRLPPQIIGDGRSTIKELIDIENARRHQQFLQTGRRLLNRMRNWPRLHHYLHLQGWTLKAVLPQGKRLTLYPIPNFSCGGSSKAIDPQTISPSLVKLAEKAAQVIDLQICGVDMIVKDNKGIIIEVNSDPGLRLHDWPNQGKPQHVAEAILKFIFSPPN